MMDLIDTQNTLIEIYLLIMSFAEEIASLTMGFSIPSYRKVATSTASSGTYIMIVFLSADVKYPGFFLPPST